MHSGSGGRGGGGVFRLFRLPLLSLASGALLALGTDSPLCRSAASGGTCSGRESTVGLFGESLPLRPPERQQINNLIFYIQHYFR